MHRESPRDVLRHPAGLNDTLVDLISVAAIADAAPTSQAHEVSAEIMARVEAQIDAYNDLIAKDVPALNKALTAAGIGVLGTA